jgi:aminoglycoside phosphotransferase (APT) family kinase protein
MEPINGIILRRDPPSGLPFSPDAARSVCESLVDNLARLHAIDYAAVGLGDFGKPAGYVERNVQSWIERYHGSKTHDYPEIERLSTWMREHLPVSGHPALIHNDYKFDNVVLDPGDLTRIIGVLDWEMSTIGDALSDLGTTLAYWVDVADPNELQNLRRGPTNYPGSLTRAEVVHRYAQASGRDVENMTFYLVFARFKLAVIVQQIYYRYRLGLTKDPRFAAMAAVVEIVLRTAWHGAQSTSI